MNDRRRASLDILRDCSPGATHDIPLQILFLITIYKLIYIIFITFFILSNFSIFILTLSFIK